jgi:uncharacterized protein (DUF736 family)
MGHKVYDNSNSGALFKNDDKQNDKSPDYRGEINVNGEPHWLNAWLKESRKGMKFMSLSIKPKNEPADKSRPLKEELKDSIPF